MNKHANLSIFIPNEGCENRCIYCDQQAVSGVYKIPAPEEVERLCDERLPWPIEQHDTEIAFFGGSFTAIDRRYMVSLLDAAYRFVREGRARGIRVSTRPDAIDGISLDILKSFGVTSIELGAQSTDDMVLLDNQRGHTRDDIIEAVSLIKKSGFSLGLQMMIGMYGEEDFETAALKTAADFIGLRPDTVRIYPTVVLRRTRLEHLYHIGAYKPLNLTQAVEIVSKLLMLFDNNGISVIRTGLHSDSELQENIVAGPFHPAFGELAMAGVYRIMIEEKVRESQSSKVTVSVAAGRKSQAAGQKLGNIKYFEKLGVRLDIVESSELKGFEIKLSRCSE